MARLLRAFPLLPGKREALASFVAELTARKAETNEFYRAYGVTRESAHLQSFPDGDLLLVCTDVAEHVEAAKSYAAETAPFHDWFKTKVLELTGIDPNKQPLGPESSCIYDWGDD
jgi:hypothetical protein